MIIVAATPPPSIDGIADICRTKTGAAIAAHLPHRSAILDIRKIGTIVEFVASVRAFQAQVLREALGLRRKDAA
jgi:hypothetical protein